MNRQLSKPIRTYERKKHKDAAVFPNTLIQPLNGVGNTNCVSIRKKLNDVKKTEVTNDSSMYYDPFDTTFDRLARNARIPPRIIKDQNNEDTYNSTDNSSSSWNISRSKNEFSVLNNIKDRKLLSMPKVMYKKQKMQIMKKTIKKQTGSQKNKKYKVKQNDTFKKYELRGKNNNRSTSMDLNSDSLHVQSDTDHSDIKNYKTQKKNHNNKKCPQPKNNRNTGKSKKNSTKNVKIKPCSVVLHRSSIEKWNSKISLIENNIKMDMHENISEKQQFAEYDTSKVNIRNLQNNNMNVKSCILKIKRLDIDSNFGKKYDNIFSSTPNSRTVKSFIHLNSLSPIPIGYCRNVNDSVMCRDIISTNADNKNLYVNEFNEPNIYLCKKKETPEKSMFGRKSDILFTSLTNVPNLSKCNLNSLENSLSKINYSGNDICNQDEHPIKETCKQSLISIQNTSSDKMRKDRISNKLTSAKEYVPDGEKTKYQLNFSIDVNKSKSLFDDTTQNIMTQSRNDVVVDNVIRMSTNNIVFDKTNTILHNEMYCNSSQLNEKQMLSANDINVKIICNKAEEKPLELLHSAKSLISDNSIDEAQIKLKVTAADNSDSNKENLCNKDNTSSINNSFVNNNKEYHLRESYVILKRLQDPIRITKRRKQSPKRNIDVTNIPDDFNNSGEQLYLERIERPKKLLSSRKGLPLLEDIVEESINNVAVEISKPIYLKPGKSWTRSLSILNNIRNESNLDKLSIGKGKKWRHSVKDVLNMQKGGIIQSCIKKNNSEKQLQVCHETVNESDCELANNRSRTSDSTNLGRLSRRISVRVVPIHKTVKSIEDASFLEVYGIVPVKSQRYTLINSCEKSSVCNTEDDDFNDENIKRYVPSTAKEVILQRCLQEDYIPSFIYFSDLYLEHCRKIGEGVYGEVFLYEHEDKKSVVKVIPIEGNQYVNGEPQKKFHEILSEIVIAMELHNLRFNTLYTTDAFVEVRNIKCIKGKYPEKLITLWNIYDEEKHSDNDCPSIFNDDQLYIVLELGHGGQDLEAYIFHTAEEAHILFIQAALALAVAEKAVEFEHRDLHWGNILISPTNESHIYYKLGQKEIKLLSKGVKVSIIDFTLSRVTYQGCSVFNDLALDPTLFTAQGEYQFEVYRLMRDKVKNDWQKFEPYTNILWLHYTLDKMITAVRYRKKNLKIHKNSITKLKELKNEILTYGSAFDFVINCDKIIDFVYDNS